MTGKPTGILLMSAHPRPIRQLAGRPVFALFMMLLGATAQAGGGACVPGLPTAIGPEFRLHSTLVNGQTSSNVVASASGGFHTIWHHGVAVYFDEVRGQRFSVDGVPIGTEMVYTDSMNGMAMGVWGDSRPVLLALAQDAVQIAWAGVYWEQTAPTTWTRRDSIVTRRFAADGAPLTPYVSAPTTFIGQPASPGLAGTPNSHFAVVWSGNGPGDTLGTFQRRFEPDGSTNGAIERLNTTTTNGQFQARVATAANGNYVVVWRGNGPGDDQGIFFRRVDAAGVPQSAEARVNVTTAGTQLLPDVAMHANGRFVIVWEGNGPGDDQGVFARRYTAGGVPLGDEIAVNVATVGNQVRPSVAVMPDGGFVVVRGGAGSGDDSGVFLRRFDAHGTPHADEVLVNTTVTNGQLRPAVAVAAGGEIMVTWDGNGVGDEYGAFGRVFGRPGNIHRGGFESPDGPCVP